EWIRDLSSLRFEVAFHGATTHSSPRQTIIEGLDRFRDTVGYDPRIYIAHVGQAEGMYWGDARLDGPLQKFYRCAHGLRGRERSYTGHVPGDPHFWGDICRERIT